MGRKQKLTKTSQRQPAKKVGAEQGRQDRKPQQKALPKRIIETAETYSPTMTRAILPGGWQAQAAAFAALLFTTLAIYIPDLHLGFFIVDDYGYVTDNPWIRGITLRNLWHILFVPYFANYSPAHILSYLLDHSIAGLNPLVYHLSSNVWAGLVAGLVFVTAFALTGRYAIAIAAAVLFVVHPAHVEAIAWISSRKDLIAAAFTLPSFVAYLYYRRGGEKARRWYVASLLLFLLGVLGKLSVATFPAVLLGFDLFVEKRPLKRSLLDKAPYLALAAVVALAAASAQPSTGNSPNAYVMAMALLQSLWLLTGFGTYVIFRIPPNPQAGAGLQILGAVMLLAAFAAPLLLRRRAPMVMALVYWILFGLIPAQVLSFIHPVADRYLFFPSVAFVILIAWGAVAAAERWSRRGLFAAMVALFALAGLWGYATLNYLAEWQDPRSVWNAAVQESADADNYHMLGAHYLNLSERLGGKPRGERLPESEARPLAMILWQGNPQLPSLLAEWANGQHGANEDAFQKYLWTLAGEALDTAVQLKGTRAMPLLFYRRGSLLFDKGDWPGARSAFLESLDENTRSTVTTARENVFCFNSLGDVAWKEEDYRDALHRYQMAEDEQTRSGGNWVPDISKSRQRTEALIALMTGASPAADDPDACYALAVRYLDAADKLGSSARGARLSDDKAKRLANDVWPGDPRLQTLLSEWAAGQHGGQMEITFQNDLRAKAWDVLERGLRAKGDKVMPSLYFRRGMVLGTRGDLAGARREFLAALSEAEGETKPEVRNEITVVSHDALGVLAWTAGDYSEALRWFSMAEDEQARFGGRWVPDIAAKRQKMQSLISAQKNG